MNNMNERGLKFMLSYAKIIVKDKRWLNKNE